jgi:polar amino acid transport system substrate-binding protein
MKKLLLIFCVFSIQVYAENNYLIVSADYPPYQYKEGGEVKGLSSTVVKKAFNDAGISYTIKFMSWARAYQTALSTPNVFIYSIARTPSRESLFKWGGRILESKNCFISLQDRGDIVINNFDQVQNYTIGAVRGDLITSMLEDEKLDINLDYVATDLQNIKKLHSERVDLIVASKAAAVYMSKQASKDHRNLKVHFCPEEFVYKFNIAANINIKEEDFRKVAHELEKLSLKESLITYAN